MNGSRDMELSLLDIGDLAYLAIWEMKLMPLIAKFSPVTESEGGGGGGRVQWAEGCIARSYLNVACTTQMTSIIGV